MALETETHTTIDLIEALGGRKTLGKNVRREEDLEAWIRTGLPFAPLEHLMKVLGLQTDIMSQFLGITTRTLQRRRTRNVLAKQEGAQLVRLARMYQRAVHILGSHEDAVHWIRHPNITLGNKSPLDLMDTPLGEERVHSLLSRIEHGVYS
jgi:putative toxin-antitoxin system antitoxin component (TIGR02293 family)